MVGFAQSQKEILVNLFKNEGLGNKYALKIQIVMNFRTWLQGNFYIVVVQQNICV